MWKRSGKTQNRRRHSGNFSIVCMIVTVLCFFCSLFTAAVFAAGNEAGTEVRVIVLDQNEQPAKPGGGTGGSSGGGNGGTKDESTAGQKDCADNESGENESGNPIGSESGNKSGNLIDDGSLNRKANENAGSGRTGSGGESEDGNADGAVTDKRNSRDGSGVDGENGRSDHESRAASADSEKTGAVAGTVQNITGCRCIWARLFGTCVICMPFHHCLRWWCWIIPFLLIVFLGALIFRNRKKRSPDRKKR